MEVVGGGHHDVQEAVKRGVPIVTFNPLHERGLVEFVNPQSPAEMLVKSPTRITSQYHQLKIGGDTVALDLPEARLKPLPRCMRIVSRSCLSMAWA